MQFIDEEGDFIRRSAVIGVLVIMSVVFSSYSLGQSSENMFLHTNQHNTFEDYYSCLLTLYDKQGVIKWNITWDNISDKPGVISENPVFDESSIYSFVGENLYCIDIESGAIKWNSNLGSEGKCDFQVSGDYLYLTEDFGADVIKVDKHSGEVLWSSTGDIMNYGSKVIGEVGDIILVKFIDYDRCGIFDGEGNFIAYKESNEIFDYFEHEKPYKVDLNYEEINDSSYSSSKEVESGEIINLYINNIINKIQIHNNGEYRESSKKGADILLNLDDNVILRISTNGDGIDTIQFSKGMKINNMKMGITSEKSKILISEIKLY